MKIIVGVTGASGAIYAKRLFEKLLAAEETNNVVVIFSEKAKQVWEYELGNKEYLEIPFKHYQPDDFFAPSASGSARFDCMIICPCSMGTLGKIAGGISDGLITRSADVMLKERHKLIIVTRESPLNLIHIRNMEQVTEAGAIVVPASPSFYSKPSTINELIDTVIDRVLRLAGFNIDGFEWGPV